MFSFLLGLLVLIGQTPATAQNEAPRSSAAGGWGYVGVYLGDMTADRARELGLSELTGAIVGKVEEGSPAARAGIKESDCILTFNGQIIRNRLQFFQMLMAATPGARVTLGINRWGTPLQVEVELGRRRPQLMEERQRLFSEAEALLVSAEERKREAEEFQARGDEKGATKLREEERAFRKLSEERRAYVEKELREGRIAEPAGLQALNLNLTLGAKRYNLGMTVLPLTPQLESFFNLSGGGVLVSEVRAGGAAEQAGIKAGDCLVSVNHQRVASPVEFNRLVDQALAGASPSDTVELVFSIVRDRNPQTARIRL